MHAKNRKNSQKSSRMNRILNNSWLNISFILLIRHLIILHQYHGIHHLYFFLYLLPIAVVCSVWFVRVFARYLLLDWHLLQCLLYYGWWSALVSCWGHRWLFGRVLDSCRLVLWLNCACGTFHGFCLAWISYSWLL